jgi:hypothetical protein
MKAVEGVRSPKIEQIFYLLIRYSVFSFIPLPKCLSQLEKISQERSAFAPGFKKRGSAS